MAKWGFDLTGFGNTPDTFKKLLSRHGLTKYKKIVHTFNEGKSKYYSFQWSGKGLMIVTGNNPITGEYSQTGSRKPEKGYASYIGIEGDVDKVKRLVDDIHKTTKEIKDESPNERQFI